MKTIATLFAWALCQFIHGQIMHQTVREDKTYEYWFSLDQFQKPMNYAIEIEHLGGNINKLTGKMTGNRKNGAITISDPQNKPLYEKTLGPELNFEFATDHKEVIVEFTVDGYVTYSKKVNAGTLSVLVLKLQPEPQDEIYQINSKNELPDTELESIMQCVNQCVQHNVNKDVFSCGKKDHYSISVQL